MIRRVRSSVDVTDRGALGHPFQHLGINAIGDTGLENNGPQLQPVAAQRIGKALPTCQLHRRGLLEFGRIGRRVAQGGVSDLQYLIALCHEDGDIGCHAREELLLVIVDADNGLVGHHVRGRRGRLSHLHHLAVENLVRKRIDGEVNVLPGAHLADVGFRHRRTDVHARNVLCDREQHGCCHRGNERLPDVNLA